MLNDLLYCPNNLPSSINSRLVDNGNGLQMHLLEAGEAGEVLLLLHGFPEIIEYRLTARKQGEMDALYVQVEDRLEQPDRIARELELRLGIRIEVSTVPTGSLPRFEGKGKRFVDERNS